MRDRGRLSVEFTEVRVQERFSGLTGSGGSAASGRLSHVLGMRNACPLRGAPPARVAFNSDAPIDQELLQLRRAAQLGEASI